MTSQDFTLFMSGLDSIGEPPAPRYYAESDGDAHTRTHYVKHSRTVERIECETRREAANLVKKLNSILS
jgi:hypothetical protein